MPLKRKVKKTGGNGNEERTSQIIIIFKRYNEEKITLKGIEKFLLTIFYRVGYTIELQYQVVARYAGKIFAKMFQKVSGLVSDFGIFLDKFIDTILEDLGEPIDRVEEACENIAEIFRQARGDNNRSAVKEIKTYIQQGITKHKKLLPIVYGYAAPCLAVLTFVLVVNYGLGKNYAIEVVLEGKTLGTIPNYTVLENADSVIKNKLVATENQSWNLDSEIKMVSSRGKEMLDERQLADNILSASDENIVEATGLYVDGAFYGAVKDARQLRQALDSLLKPYQNGNEGRTVSFLQDVKVTDGIFFTESIVEDEQLAQMVTSEVSGKKTYTVVAGDSPSLIAQKNAITLKQLYALNPEMEGGGLWPGNEVLVGASVPFLRVKVVERSARQVEVPFKTKTEQNNSMSLGTTKVSVQGEKGVNEEVVDTEYIDGIYQKETIVSTTVLKEPVTQVIQRGTLFNGTVVDVQGTGQLMWPTAAGRVSRGFTGQYPAHNGLDIAAPIGTAIYAADSGVVTKALYTSRGYGIYAIIDHGNGYQTLYGHCSALLVNVGQRVTKGQLIARVGNSGNSTGPHVHFEVKSGNTRYDPYRFF